jgi:outer membrane protein assembly factor BamE
MQRRAVASPDSPMRPLPRAFPTASAAVALAALAGCAGAPPEADSLFGVITPYRFEIVQGNVVTREQIERLTTGMTRRQARELLGTPMLADAFHTDRWDYVFTIRRQGAQPQRRSVVLHFDGERLARIDAGELPSEHEFVASISRHRDFAPKRLELTPEERAALPRPPAVAPGAAIEPLGPARPYPPLEGS